MSNSATPCLLKCPFRRYHPEIDSHISIKEKEIPSFPSIICKNIRLSSFEEIIKSPWIRPFDVHHYTELGIDYIKLGERGKNTEWIIDLARHYLKEKDDADFYQFVEKNSWNFFQEKIKNLENLEISIPFLPNDRTLHIRYGARSEGGTGRKRGLGKMSRRTPSSILKVKNKAFLII